MTNAIVIGRKRRGRDVAGTAAETAAVLATAGWDVQTRIVRKKKALRKRASAAVAAKTAVVVVVGGDGAVLQAIQSLAGTDVGLGIIPFGTGNLVAGNLQLPTKPADAAALIVANKQRRIDLGSVRIQGRDELFAVACGVGFDAQVMRGTAKRQKVRFGKLAYLASALRQRKHLADVEHVITIDGHRTRMRASQVFVANMGRLPGGLEPRLEITPDDALLDVIAVRAANPLTGVFAAWDAIRQRRSGRSRSQRVLRARGREVRIEATADRLVETDGSVIGTTPIEIGIRPKALTVIVP